MLKRTRHDGWLMACHAYGHGRWLSHCVQFLDVTQNLIKNVADVIPPVTRLCTLCTLVTKMLCCPIIFEWTSSLGWLHFLWCLPAKGVPWLMCKFWLNLVWYKSSNRCAVNNHRQVTLRWTGETRCIHKIIGQYNILVHKVEQCEQPWHNWYKICHILYQVLCNIHELYIVALPYAMAISMAFHQPQIMPCYP